MTNHINRVLILALGIAIGVIAMLLKDRNRGEIATSATPSPAPSISILERTSVLPSPATGTDNTRTSSNDQEEEDLTDADTAAFEEEMQRVLRGDATDEEQIAFWQGIQSSKRLDSLIKDLQNTATADSQDIATRLSLAQAYVTKILSAPAGPARGLWAAKAETVWKEVLEVDSENWEAQRSIAFSYSQYPDFLNKTGVAIAEFEKTITIQEDSNETRGRFANSYIELAKLHLKSGDPSNALATLEKGAAKHPDNNDLASQLETISSSYKFEEAPAEDGQ